MEMKLSEFVAAFERGEAVQFRASDGVWADKNTNNWASNTAYRLKPKPAELWVNFYNGSPPSAHTTSAAAEKFVRKNLVSHLTTRVAIHMREVV